MIRALLMCAAIATASAGGDNTKTKNSTNNVSKREILEFYPDWVPFKNKHGDELGEFVDVTKPKAKVKKRLALPMNFLIRAVADDDAGEYTGQGESDNDDYFDKKDWSDLNRPVHNASEPQEEQGQNEPDQQQQKEDSDIDGLINIITQSTPSLADDINRSITKEPDVNLDDDDISEKKDNITALVEENPISTPETELRYPLTPRPGVQVYSEDEDDSEPANKNQEQSQEETQKISPEEQKENEEKKRLILNSVDQLKMRHEQEQRAISIKNIQDEYDNEQRHRNIQKKKNRNSKRYRTKTTPANYDEYEDLSWNDKYKINVEKKTSTEDAEYPVMQQVTKKPRQLKSSTTTYKPVDPERAKYSLFKNPGLYTIDDDDEDERKPPKKTPNTPRRFSSKYNSAENHFTNSATTTEKDEPILYFPKIKPKRKSKKAKARTTEAPDSYVAETMEDKLTKKQTTQPITYPDITSLANDDYKTTALGYDYPTSTVSLWKDTSALDNGNSIRNSDNVLNTTPQYEDLPADAPTGPSGEAETSNSETVTDAVPASSDHKKEEGPKDYHVEKGGGKQHASSYEEEHEEHGKKAYEGVHKESKAKKGHHDKEDHLGKYEDRGGHDKQHHDESGHYGAHHHEEHGKKQAKYEESGKHSKGHSTKGSHDIHKKEEYEKKVEFFEEEGDSAEEEKHGGYHNEKKHESGGHFKKGKLNNDHHENKKGESGHFLKAGHHFTNKGHKASGGHDGHGKHHAAHHQAGGHHGGKKWVYHHGHPAQNANLIVIDRRAEKLMNGPVYYG